MRTPVKLLVLLAGGINYVVNTSVFTQSVGAELVTNGTPPILFTGDNPTNYTVIGEVVLDPAVHQVGSGQDHLGVGTGAMNIYSSATNFVPILKPTVTIPVGSSIIAKALCSLRAAGTVQASDGASHTVMSFTSAVEQTTVDYVSIANNYQLAGVTAPTDLTFDSLSLKIVTLNTQALTAANAISDLLFDLPVTPLNGMRIYLMVRIQDSANFLRIYLKRSGSSYDMIMEKVVAYSATQLRAVVGVGTNINGMRFDCNGSILKMFTTIDNENNWVQQGANVTDAAFATATGLNTLYNVEFNPRLLRSQVY